MTVPRSTRLQKNLPYALRFWELRKKLRLQLRNRVKSRALNDKRRNTMITHRGKGAGGYAGRAFAVRRSFAACISSLFTPDGAFRTGSEQAASDGAHPGS